jgi:hypothetical protein
VDPDWLIAYVSIDCSREGRTIIHDEQGAGRKEAGDVIEAGVRDSARGVRHHQSDLIARGAAATTLDRALRRRPARDAKVLAPRVAEGRRMPYGLSTAQIQG